MDCRHLIIIPDNGWGSVAFQKPVRTAQKDNYSWNAGISATISIPLDGGIQERFASCNDNAEQDPDADAA